MATRGQDIVAVIKQQIKQFGTAVALVDVGTVIEVGDGIARIHGLAAARYNELLQFPNDIIGIALNLEAVEYMDSAGLGCCAAVKKLMSNNGGGAKAVFGASQNIKKMWGLIRLDLVIPTFPDAEAALAYLSGNL